MGFKRVLIISDLHAPAYHPDTVAFLEAIKNKFRPDKVISVGDEADFHASSFHAHDPDLSSPGQELIETKKKLSHIAKLFPAMDLVDSNHGSMMFRKALQHGMPRGALKTYRETLDAPKNWHWHDELIIKASNGQDIYICHSKGQNVLAVSQAMGMSVIQGHHHNLFEIRYWGNPRALYFAMHVGCLINDHALNFAYNKTSIKRPVIGCGIILDGYPRLLPMVLNRGGRWIKKIV